MFDIRDQGTKVFKPILGSGMKNSFWPPPIGEFCNNNNNNNVYYLYEYSEKSRPKLLVKMSDDCKTLDDDHDSRFMFDQQSLSGGKRGRQEADLWRVSLPLYP